MATSPPSQATNASTNSSSSSPIMEYFTPSWRRPSRKNDVVISESLPTNPSLWWRYPCLVCHKPPPPTLAHAETSTADSIIDSQSSPPGMCHKRCSRCHSAVYCSPKCQKQDYTNGKHKPNCIALAKLWDEKTKLETRLWESKSKSSTNPFDDEVEEVYDYPIVGQFWHDAPTSEVQKNSTKYCVVLIQLVQLLGRGESWRVSRIQHHQHDHQQEEEEGNTNHCLSDSSRSTARRGMGNPLSRELAIDIAYQLSALDRTDMRVRLLIPSLLLEGGYYQEAYDFLRHWLHVDASLMIMDLAMMGGPGMGAMEEEGGEGKKTMSVLQVGGDLLESPEQWMDGEMIYPSIGMVFELAFLKCHLLCLLRSGEFQTGDDDNGSSCRAFEMEEHSGTEPMTLAEKCVDVGEEELERQVRLLLSLVHKWNPHLLPKLGEPYDIETGANKKANIVVEDGDITVPATPPALSTLLDKHHPGFELQYKMGNPGGRTVDEAVSIWQRDMILWHVVNPMAMKYLSEFCLDLEENLVDTSCLNGGVESKSDPSLGNGTNNTTAAQNTENVLKRREAEELVAKLKLEDPNRTMDEMMMHPEMAQLMIKHLHTV
mmetsp:Transcript_18508/g.40062  ORF Transcript_18508/g.40062 Transcript_18508/m.40062 type:complete len:599 (+) Transcript_18508:60-1856(+)